MYIISEYEDIMSNLFLKWSSHLELLTSLDQLLEEDSFVDVTIAVDGELLKAHKVILCASSPYFRAILQSNPSPHPIIFMRDVKLLEMKAILDFIYKGEVCVSEEHIHGVLNTAEALKVTGLSNISWTESTMNYVHVGDSHSIDKVSLPCHASKEQNSSIEHVHQEQKKALNKKIQILKSIPDAQLVTNNKMSVLIQQPTAIKNDGYSFGQNKEDSSTIMQEDTTNLMQQTYEETAGDMAVCSGGSTVMVLETPPEVCIASLSSTTTQDKPPGRQYTKEDLQQALNLVRHGQMGIKPAARAYNIPVTTLHHAARRNKISSPMQQGGNHVSYKTLQRNKESSANTVLPGEWPQLLLK